MAASNWISLLIVLINIFIIAMEKGPFIKLLVWLIILEHHLKVSPDVATLLHGTRDSALMEHCSTLLQVHPTVSGSSDSWKHTLRTQPSCSPGDIERGCKRMDLLPLLMQSLEFFLIWTNVSVPYGAKEPCYQCSKDQSCIIWTELYCYN